MRKPFLCRERKSPAARARRSAGELFAQELLAPELARLVAVAKPLAAVEFVLVEQALAGAADKGGGDVVQVGGRLLGQRIDMAHPVDVDRLVLRHGGALEIGARRQMKDGGQRIGQAAVGLRGKTEFGQGDVARQVGAAGVGQEVAVFWRLAAEHHHLPAHGEQRRHQRPADHAGAAGDKNPRADHVITWRPA